jgi:hypothetical protein
MRIHVYGCSWSSGLPADEFGSWCKELAKLEPSWKIYNFGVGGSSIHFSSYNWLWSKQNIKEPIYHIFQCTSQYRWTSFPHNLNPMNYMQQHTHNYWSFHPAKDNHIRNDINTFQVKNRRAGDKHTMRFYKNKLQQESEHQWEIERFSVFEALRNNIDLVFFHRYHDSRDYKKYFNNYVMCIADILGKDKFYDFIIDNGHHFGTEGQIWQANFLRDYIKNDI